MTPARALFGFSVSTRPFFSNLVQGRYLNRSVQTSSVSDIPARGGAVAPVLLELLRCPACHSRLSDKDGLALVCACGNTTPVRDGIPRFVSDDGYVSSFSYEWRKHARTQLDSAGAGNRSEEQFQSRLDRPLSWLKGKV